MTQQKLEELGFYKDTNFIKQIHNADTPTMELGWFGLRIDGFEKLTASELVCKIYDAGIKEGYKKGCNSIRQSINDILKVEE